MEGLRLLLPAFVAVALVAASWLVHYPGSVPAGWDHSDGSISSVTARTVQGRKLYYPRVQYLALGYSYEIEDRAGSTAYPALATAVPVVYDPGAPQTAKLADELPPNYYAWALRGAGGLLLLVWAFALFALWRRERQAAAPDEAAAYEPVSAGLEGADAAEDVIEEPAGAEVPDMAEVPVAIAEESAAAEEAAVPALPGGIVRPEAAEAVPGEPLPEAATATEGSPLETAEQPPPAPKKIIVTIAPEEADAPPVKRKAAAKRTRKVPVKGSATAVKKPARPVAPAKVQSAKKRAARKTAKKPAPKRNAKK
jgi:hypothetical protein